MEVSIETYRSRIGVFDLKPKARKPKKCSVYDTTTKKNNKTIKKQNISYLIILVLLLCDATKYHCKIQYNNSSTHDKEVSSSSSIVDTSFETYDSISNSSSSFIWLGRKERNKLHHIKHGNRGRDMKRKGIQCLYWNKGPSFLVNKHLDIETIIAEHKPHILGLGEANVHHGQDLQDVQHAGYTLHLDSSIDNPNLGVARVAVYTHNSLRVKRRLDLETETVSVCCLVGVWTAREEIFHHL